MSLDPQIPVTPPDLATLMDLKIRDALSSTRCHQLGTIQTFDPAKQSASVSLNVRSLVAGEIKSYPVLVDVPVFVLGGGDRCFTFPVRPGDTCLVCFNDRDIDNWFSTGSVSVPNTPRIHDLSDGLALVGFRSLANPVASYSTTDMEMRNGVNKIAVGDKILMKNGSTDLLSVLQAAASAMNALNGKNGVDCSSTITNFQTLLAQLLKSS